MLDDLRWLLAQPSMTDPLTTAVTGYPLPVLPEQPSHDGVVHIPDGCRDTKAIPGGTTGTVPSAPGPQYLRVPFADVLTGDTTVCRKCLDMHFQLLSSASRAPHWNLVKDMPRWAQGLRALTDEAAGPLTGFTAVPWGATRTVVTSGYTPDMRAATDALQGEFDRLTGDLVRRIVAEHPHWLLVRYVADAGLVDDDLPHTLQSGSSFGLDRCDRDALDAAIDTARLVLATSPAVPFLYRRRKKSGVAFRDRHLLPPVGTVDLGDTTVTVTALPRQLAPHVDADQGFRAGWLDLEPGWQDDPATWRRLETAASLWTGRSDDTFATLDAAWDAAGQLVA